MKRWENAEIVVLGIEATQGELKSGNKVDKWITSDVEGTKEPYTYINSGDTNYTTNVDAK